MTDIVYQDRSAFVGSYLARIGISSRSMIPSLRILTILALLGAFWAAVGSHARGDEDQPKPPEVVPSPDAPDQNAPNQNESDKKTEKRPATRRKSADELYSTPAADSEKAPKADAVADSPIPGLESDGAPETTGADIVPYRWLDQNYQYLNEGDPYPPGQDPLREWPGVSVGWFSGIEVTAAQPRVHSELNSAQLGPGDAVSGIFANTFQLSAANFNWTAMPKVFVGYRRENGLGEIIASYRFVQSEGSSTIPGFDAAGAGRLDSRITANVIDLDYGYTDPVEGYLPWYLPHLVRRTAGIRFASAVFDTTASGQQILQERSGNVFLGAGPRVNFEGTWPTGISELSFIGGVDASGVIGFNYQRYGEQALIGPTLVSGSGRTDGTTTVTPILRVQAALSWVPAWGDESLRFSAGYQWERWWFLTDTASVADLTLSGPFVRGEWRY